MTALVQRLDGIDGAIADLRVAVEAEAAERVELEQWVAAIADSARPRIPKPGGR